MRKVFIHIGLPKTGTSFLQTHVFPVWQGLAFVRNPTLDNLVSLERDRKVLISKEGLSGRPWHSYESHRDWRWQQSQETYLDNLRDLYPDAKVLISFRKHASYILSLYKQYLHLGGTAEFAEFFSAAGPDGILKRDDLYFRHLIERVEARFAGRPFVFMQEEMRDDLDHLLREMGDFFGEAPPDISHVRRREQNKGVGHYQAKLLILLNKINRSDLNPGGLVPLANRYTVLLRLDPRRVCQEWLAFLSSRPLTLPEETRLCIDGLYAADWQYVREYAKGRVG